MLSLSVTTTVCNRFDRKQFIDFLFSFAQTALQPVTTWQLDKSIQLNHWLKFTSRILNWKFSKSNPYWSTQKFLPQHPWIQMWLKQANTVSVTKAADTFDGLTSEAVWRPRLVLPYHVRTDGLESSRLSVLRAPPSVNLLTAAALLGPGGGGGTRVPSGGGVRRRCQGRPTKYSR